MPKPAPPNSSFREREPGTLNGRAGRRFIFDAKNYPSSGQHCGRTYTVCWKGDLHELGVVPCVAHIYFVGRSPVWLANRSSARVAIEADHKESRGVRQRRSLQVDRVVRIVRGYCGEGARDCCDCADQVFRGASRISSVPSWTFDYYREHGIRLLAFAALGHGLDPKVLDEPLVTTVAGCVHKPPAQVVLAWAVERGTAFVTISTTPRHIQENFEIPAPA